MRDIDKDFCRLSESSLAKEWLSEEDNVWDEFYADKIPNKATRKAINNARNGKVDTAKSANHLFDSIT